MVLQGKVSCTVIKKYIFRILAVVTTVAISMFLLAGCKKSQPAQSASSRPGFNSSQMKQQEKTELAALVKAGTINQAQSDKIITTLSSMTTGFGGQRRNGASGTGSYQRPSGSQNGTPGASDGNGGYYPARSSGASGTSSGASSDRGGFQRSNLLSSLVQNGTITQAQANAVTQALFSNRSGGQGGGPNNSQGG